MKRILLVGANSMLGSSLAPYLDSKGYSVIRYSRSSESKLSTAGMEDYATSKNAILAASPQVIINLVANTNVDGCESNPVAAYQSNTLVVENISRCILEELQLCKLIHISTDQIYDGVGPHSEEIALPANYYSLSKYAGELAAAKVESLIFRTNFFGRSEKPERYSFSDWLVSAMKNQQKINVYDNVLFSPLSMKTLIVLIELAINSDRIGTYNVGASEGMSKADFAFALADVLNLSNNYMTRCSAPDEKNGVYRPKDMRLNCSKFEAAFDITLPKLIDEIGTTRNAYG